MDNHLSIIKKVLSEKFGIAEEQITPTASLAGDLNLGKIEIIDLLELVSSQLNVPLPDDLSLENLNTIEDLLNLLEQQSLEI